MQKEIFGKNDRITDGEGKTEVPEVRQQENGKTSYWFYCGHIKEKLKQDLSDPASTESSFCFLMPLFFKESDVFHFRRFRAAHCIDG